MEDRECVWEDRDEDEDVCTFVTVILVASVGGVGSSLGIGATTAHGALCFVEDTVHCEVRLFGWGLYGRSLVD